MLPPEFKEKFRNLNAYGNLLLVSPETFLYIISQIEKPLVLIGTRFWGKKQYLTSYKGISFATTSKEPLHLAENTEILIVNSIIISKYYGQRI